MPAVPVLSMLALCVTLTAQASSSHAATEPAVLRNAVPAVAATAVEPAIAGAASFDLDATRSFERDGHGPSDAGAIDEPSRAPESAFGRGFSASEAMLLLLVGTCMVWVGFAKRRNHPPRRVVR